MKKKVLMVLMTVFVGWLIMAEAEFAFAYGEQIESSLTNLLKWITGVLGGLAVAFGMVWTGIRISMHDEKALSTGIKIIAGGILIFSSIKIVELLRAIFQ